MENRKSYETPLTILLWILVVGAVFSAISNFLFIVLLSKSDFLDMIMEMLGF